MAGTRHDSYKSCIKIRSDYCNRFKKKHVRLGKYSKQTKLDREKAKRKRERINAKRAAKGRKDFLKRPYNRKALVDAFNAAEPAAPAMM